MVTLTSEEKDIVIIQEYMPTSQHSDEEVEESYEKVEQIIDRAKSGACVVIIGNWNVVSGKEIDDQTVGEYGLGEGNERGERMVRFCKESSLIVGNTVFNHHLLRILHDKGK